MVYRSTTFVYIVFANDPRIRSLIITKLCCQAASLVLLTELNQAIVSQLASVFKRHVYIVRHRWPNQPGHVELLRANSSARTRP